MSHPNACGHCGAEYDRDLGHTCDAADAFDRISDLEDKLNDLEEKLEAATEKNERLASALDRTTHAARCLCDFLGLSEGEIAAIFKDP